jgi:hypothetical protein
MITGMKDHFNGQLETRPKPKIIITYEQLAQVAEYKSWLELGGRDGGIKDPSKEHNVKHLSIFMIYHIGRYHYKKM